MTALKSRAAPDPSRDAAGSVDGPNPAAGITPYEGTASPSTDPERAAWLEWRGHGVGASDVAGIVGLSPWQSPWSIWAEKVGLSAGQDETRAMRFGKIMEPVLRDMFKQETGLYVRGEQTWCQHPDDPWMRCTVDGFVYDGQDPDEDNRFLIHVNAATADFALGVYEAKTTSEAPWDEVPVHYQCQASWAMAITGLPTCWFGVLHMAFGRPDFRVYQFDREGDDIARLVERCRTFWFDNVVAGIAPPADGHKATADALAGAWEVDDELFTLAGAHEQAVVSALHEMKADAKRIEAEIAQLENELKDCLGASHALITSEVDGKGRPVVLATWKAQDRTTVDTKALRADLPDIAAKYESTTTSRVLRLKPIKES